MKGWIRGHRNNRVETLLAEARAVYGGDIISSTERSMRQRPHPSKAAIKNTNAACTPPKKFNMEKPEVKIIKVEGDSNSGNQKVYSTLEEFDWSRTEEDTFDATKTHDNNPVFKPTQSKSEALNHEAPAIEEKENETMEVEGKGSNDTAAEEISPRISLPLKSCALDVRTDLGLLDI